MNQLEIENQINSQNNPQIYQSVMNDIAKPKMKIATTSEEKNKIYRLRYAVNIEELNEPLISVSHQYKQIKDEHDATAMHIAAYLNTEAIGACRMNFVGKDYIDEFGTYELDRFDSTNPEDVVVVSKLFIKKEHRGKGLFATILHHAYALAMMQECKVALACIPTSWVSVFSSYGFISYRGTVLHPELGQVVPMYLDLQNEKFMNDIRSPFCKLFDAFKENAEHQFVN